MTRCLAFHSSYRCRHSGRCCTSGWPIPVETGLRRRLDEALARGALKLPAGGGHPFADEGEMPPGTQGILRVNAHGACAFYDHGSRRCAVHSALGHDALPVSCQHFPRVCLVDGAGTFVTLSHYCPTAANLLFQDGPAAPAVGPRFCLADERLAVVQAPPGFAPMALEGLDARDALPPLLHPAMLMDAEAYHAWEAVVVGIFGGEGPAEEVLAGAIRFTERLRTWEPPRGRLVEAVEAQRGSPGGAERDGVAPALTAAALSLDRIVREAVPPGLQAPSQPPEAANDFARFVAPAWPAFARPVKRYLGARAFANWCAYQGRGLRTVLCSVAATLSVLRVEAARHCAQAGRPLDTSLLTEAFRSADLLIVHLGSREDLARRLSGIEDESVQEMIEAL